MIRLLHVADVHLGAAYSGFQPIAEVRREEVLDAFRRLPELAEGAEAHAVVMCGDIFDGPRPPNKVVAAVREAARRLQEAGCPVFAVPGNHDAFALNPTLYEEALAGAHVFREPTFGSPVTVETAAGPLHVYGLAHDRARAPDPLGSYQRIEASGAHVVLLHGAVPDAPHWGEPSSLSLPLERLSELDADYIALGDYHRFRPPEEFGAEEDFSGCYAGSFAAVDLGEDGPRGYVIADVEARTPPRVRHAPSGVRELLRVADFDVSACADELAVADALRERIPESVIPLVRLTGEPSFPLEVEKIRLQLEERFGCVRLEDRTRFFASTRLAEIAQERTIAGHVARLGLRRVEEAEGAEERRERERALRIALRSLGVS